MKLLFVVIWLALVCAPAMSQTVTYDAGNYHPTTGYDLLRECKLADELNDHSTKTPDEVVMATHCLGILDGMQFVYRQWAVRGTNPLLCIPDSVNTTGELVHQVVGFLSDYPPAWKERYSVALVHVLVNLYGCPASH